MANRNIMKIIEGVRVSPLYEMRLRDITKIRTVCGDDVALAMVYAFEFGYTQGQKALKAEYRRAKESAPADCSNRDANHSGNKTTIHAESVPQ